MEVKEEITNQAHYEFSGLKKGVLYARPFRHLTPTAKLLWASFVISILCMIPGFIYAGIFPFGGNTTMAVDLRNEYVGFYEAFRHALHSPGGFFYSLTKSLGGEMAGTFSYYMMSPFNLLFFLLPSRFMPYAIEFSQLLKLGLASMAMAYFLIKSEHGHDYRVVVIAVCYGLCSFSTAYLLNHMWIDPLILFPLVCHQAERVVNGKNPLAYVLLLLAMIVSNFYIGFMGCVFLGLFMIYYLLRQDRNSSFSKREWVQVQIVSYLRFAFFSVLAALMTCWLLLPSLYSVALSKGTYRSEVVANWTFRYFPVDFFSKLLPAAFNYDQVPSGLPNVFTGSLTLFLAIFYFGERRISKKERISAFVLLLFLFLSMNIDKLNVFWHGMQYPIWYEYRFSWVFSFLLCVLAFRQWMRMEKLGKRRTTFLLLGIALVFLYLGVQLASFPFLTYFHLLGAGIFWLLLLLLLRQIIRQRGRKRPWMVPLFCLLLFLELALNAGVHTGSYNYESLEEFQSYDAILRSVANKYRPDAHSFYRIEKTFMHDNNDGMRFQLPGLTHFNSALDRNSIDLLSDFGFYVTNNSINGTNPTKFTDALFSVKYYLTPRNESMMHFQGKNNFRLRSHRPDLKNMSKVQDTTFLQVMENPYWMPLGLLAEKKLPDLHAERANPLDWQDEVANVLDGKDGTINYFKLETMPDPEVTNLVKKEGKKYTTYTRESSDKELEASLVYRIPTVEHASNYLTVSNTLNNKNSKLSINGKSLENKRGGSHRTSQLVNLKEANPKSTVEEFKVALDKKKLSMDMNNISLFTLSESDLQDEVNFQQKGGLQVEKCSDQLIEGTIRPTANTPYLLVSLPYDMGWTATIDGKEVRPIKVLDSLMALPIQPGAKRVRLSYELPYLKLGLALSLGALFAFGAYELLKKRKEKEGIR